MVIVILLLNLSYVILISTYWLVPEFFKELFLRNDSSWWLKNHQLRPNSRIRIYKLLICIHLPMLLLYWRKCHFLSYSYIRCLMKNPAERLKIYAYFENSQTGSWGPFDSPEGWVHHNICLAIFGLVLGAILESKKNWPGQQGGSGNGKNQPKICLCNTSEIGLWGLFNPLGKGWAQNLSVPEYWVQWWVEFEAKSVAQGHHRRLKKDKKWRKNGQNWPISSPHK